MLSENSATNKSLSMILWAILILLFILVMGLGWYFFDVRGERKQNQSTVKEINNINTIKENSLDLSNNDPEVGGIVEKVSRHMLLPAKNFTVATVKDETALWKENPILFSYIRNGQKLLLYDTGVVVYDPAIDKIVDIVQLYNIRQQKLSN